MYSFIVCIVCSQLFRECCEVLKRTCYHVVQHVFSVTYCDVTPLFDLFSRYGKYICYSDTFYNCTIFILFNVEYADECHYIVRMIFSLEKCISPSNLRSVLGVLKKSCYE